jgi:hypothetical protein
MRSSRISDCEINVRESQSSIGILHERRGRWAESVTFADIGSRAATPLYMDGGNNITISDFDFTAEGSEELHACIDCGPLTTPDTWTIGPGTCQGGDHLFRLQSSPKRNGSGLKLDMVRWEQSTDYGQPGIIINCPWRQGRRTRTGLRFALMTGVVMKAREVAIEHRAVGELAVVACSMPGQVVEA